MSEHDPEREAAAYVTGVMTSAERERFEAHLLTCDTCWREVRLDREGQRMAESAREPAPANLRATVRAAVRSAAQEGDVARPSTPRRWSAVWQGVAAVVVLIVLVVAGITARNPAEPPVIGAAMAAYEHAAVEGHHEPMPAPDLSSLGMAPVGAAHMALGGTIVEAFAYRSDAGSRLSLFMADTAFPAPPGATSTSEGWHLSSGDVGLMSGEQPVPYLVVTSDRPLMDSLQQALDSGSVLLT